MARRRGIRLKACRVCKMLSLPDEETCPNCGSNDFSNDWSGLIIVLDEKSIIAENTGVQKTGRYAIKVR